MTFMAFYPSKMESSKKCFLDHDMKNGLYIHYSQPKLLGAVPSAQLRQWVRGKAECKLERVILAGQGHRLLAEAETLPLSRYLTNLIIKCDALHAAVEKGSLLELQELLDHDHNRHKYVACYDEAGVGLLHKAVFYSYMDIVKWLVANYPQLVHQRDSEGRIPLHYSAASRDEAAVAALLEGAGAARGARDAGGRTLAHYRAARTLLTLPTLSSAADMPARPNANPPGLVIKRHNIRIWCHECDMGRLQRVVWEGQGARLLSEVSSQPVVKRFLEAVPYIMNTIRDIHSAVIQNDLEGLLKLSSDPVPPQALSSRDAKNMTAMHKAAGLGHGGILKYILTRYPQGINDIDNDGRTPLHYAAVVKDDQHTYNTLISAGADESAVDNKNKTPAYYINRTQDIDKNLFKILPEAPRTPSSTYPPSWDWKILDTGFRGEINTKKTRKKNLKASSENISSKNNTNTITDSVENNNIVSLKNSSTHELISDLPDLNDSDKQNVSNNETREDHAQNIKETSEFNAADSEEEETKEIKEKTEDAENLSTDNGDIENTSQGPFPEEHSSENVEKKIKENENGDPVQEQARNESNESDGELEENIDIIYNDKAEETVLKSSESEESKEKHDILSNELTENAGENKDKTNYIDNKKDISIKDEIITKKETPYGSTYNSPEKIPDESNLKQNDSQQEQVESDEHNHDDTKKVNGHNDNIKFKDSNGHDSSTNEDAETKQEEDACEGNTNHDNNEDDDDVQVQGICQPDQNDIDTKSPTLKQINSSAKRGNVTHGRNIPENLIEGIISSEAEQETEDASITQRDNSVQRNTVVDNEIDPEVTDLINTANMEMLATLVLNGEGSRLIGRRSGNVELQAFLDNVPTYMQKINRVHIAARDGNIRDLQAALDRRKFAIARDPISANGATPLHVATIHGKTNIIKYLGGRFPETLSAVDFEGRTALHFAAVLPDNGHYYNLLQQLGANSKDLDDIGRSAEDYYRNPTLLPYRQLLSDFGISEEKARSMFSDQISGMNHVANGHMDIPIFHTEEGRYLAQSLGDPLIKGLTEVANVKPKDPVAFLATFLHNFPDQDKTRLGTKETSIIVTKETPEVDNEQLPLDLEDEEEPQMEKIIEDRNRTGARTATRTETRPNRPIEVIAVEPNPDTRPDAPEEAFSSANRDEHGQSMLHFAAARTHTNNALFQLLQESDVSLGFRDELYRTARDVSIQANVLENTTEIDRWVLHLAARGKTDQIMELLLQGYDHILDVVDDEGVPISEVVAQRGDDKTINLLASIPAFEESRETLHGAIRRGDLTAVQAMVKAEGGRTLARAQNTFGRNALHVAVLAQHEDIVAYLAKNCPELLRLGDNLERTALHYAMGVNKMESLSHLLIQAGAKRVLKDLKGRQPSYYYMNKSDILRLKEEEEAY